MTALQCHSKLITELTIDIGFFSLILPKYFIGLGNIYQHIFVMSSKNICLDISARLYKTAPGEQCSTLRRRTIAVTTGNLRVTNGRQGLLFCSVMISFSNNKFSYYFPPQRPGSAAECFANLCPSALSYFPASCPTVEYIDCRYYRYIYASTASSKITVKILNIEMMSGET